MDFDELDDLELIKAKDELKERFERARSGKGFATDSEKERQHQEVLDRQAEEERKKAEEERLQAEKKAAELERLRREAYEVLGLPPPAPVPVPAPASALLAKLMDDPPAPPAPPAPASSGASTTPGMGGRRPRPRVGARTRHSIRERGSTLIKLKSCKCCNDDERDAFCKEPF
mmetsp:Transcript_98188/g.161670  ORF Transcript_98188/g.161670 Transcript_98188/m.161670 type:complete len:173 (-) Transcript_98188:59-577(-)